MKTSKIVATLLCLAFLMCSLCGCSPKTAITGEEFTEKMEAEGFVIEDLTYALDSDALAKLALVASNGNFQIDFYHLTSIENSKAVFLNNKDLFKDGDFSFSSELSLSGTNNDYYELTADGEFHMIARVDDTMLWSEADESYKADIIDAVKMLGYK